MEEYPLSYTAYIQPYTISRIDGLSNDVGLDIRGFEVYNEEYPAGGKDRESSQEIIRNMVINDN